MGKHRNRNIGIHRVEYRAWWNMIRRCYDPKCPSYKRYGERGITVCREWLGSFDSFLQHIGPKPTRDLTLDRIDNEWHYQPGNVRWASCSTQIRNRSIRSSKRALSFNGTTKTMAAWERTVGLNPGRILARLNAGWDERKAVFTPTYKTRLTSRPIRVIIPTAAMRGPGGGFHRGWVRALSPVFHPTGPAFHMSELLQAQFEFTQDLARLILWIGTHPGWQCKLSECGVQLQRKVAQADGVKVATDRVHIPNSNHYRALAADLNLFIDGQPITDSGHTAWSLIETYWQLLRGRNRTGRSFGDANHISVSWEGVI